MLRGKRPRPPIMRRTKSMSGGMSVDIQEPDQPSLKPINLEAHREEIVMSDHHHNPLHPQPCHHDQDIIKLDPPTVVMETGTGTHGGSMVPNDLTNTVLVGSTVMFPNSTTIINNNHNYNPISDHVIHSTPHFLRTCGLCNCRLAPGRDIYMYRGDTAFCSLECREQQMKQDRKIEKWKVAVSNKEGHRVSPPCTATVKASTKNQTATCT